MSKDICAVEFYYPPPLLRQYELPALLLFSRSDGRMSFPKLGSICVNFTFACFMIRETQAELDFLEYRSKTGHRSFV